MACSHSLQWAIAIARVAHAASVENTAFGEKILLTECTLGCNTVLLV